MNNENSKPRNADDVSSRILTGSQNFGRSPPSKINNPLKETFDFFFRPLNLMPKTRTKTPFPNKKFVLRLQELGDVHGTVPLHLAALRGHLEVVQTLVLAGRRWEGRLGRLQLEFC